MSIVTLEGIVQEGQIRLKTDFHLPDKTKVYVVVPDIQVEEHAHFSINNHQSTIINRKSSTH